MRSLSSCLREDSLSAATRFFYTFQLFKLAEHYQSQCQSLPFHPDNLIVHSSTETIEYRANIKTKVSYTFAFDRCLLSPEVIRKLLVDSIPLLAENAISVQTDHLHENIYRLGCIIYEVSCVYDSEITFLKLGIPAVDMV